jgi:hypothetical protein
VRIEIQIVDVDFSGTYAGNYDEIFPGYTRLISLRVILPKDWQDGTFQADCIDWNGPVDVGKAAINTSFEYVNNDGYAVVPVSDLALLSGGFGNNGSFAIVTQPATAQSWLTNETETFSFEYSGKITKIQ